MLSPALYGMYVTKRLVVHVGAATPIFSNNETIQQFFVYRLRIDMSIFVVARGLCKVMDMLENNFWNSTTLQLINGRIHWTRLSHRIYWYMIMCVSSLSMRLFPHMLMIWRVLYYVTQRTNWRTNFNMLTKSFVLYWMLLELLKIWISKNMYLVLQVGNQIATHLKFLNVGFFQVKPVLLLATWVLCTISATTIMLKLTTDCAKLTQDGTQWVEFGFGTVCVGLPSFLFSKEWCIHLSCQDRRRFVYHTHMLSVWTNTFLKEVENSCMVPPATRLLLAQEQNTKLSHRWKSGGSCVWSRPGLNYVYVDSNFGRMLQHFLRNIPYFLLAYLLNLISNSAVQLTTMENQLLPPILGSGRRLLTLMRWVNWILEPFSVLKCRAGFCSFFHNFVKMFCGSLGHEIPPPEFVSPVSEPRVLLVLPDDCPYVCDLLRADGSVWNQKFASQSAHILHSRGGDHGSRPIYPLAAVSNICPWCRCKYSTRISASQHIKAAFERGQCTGKGSAFNPAILPAKSLQCPVCQDERHSMEDLLQHISAHDTPAAFFARHFQQDWRANCHVCSFVAAWSRWRWWPTGSSTTSWSACPWNQRRKPQEIDSPLGQVGSQKLFWYPRTAERNSHHPTGPKRHGGCRCHVSCNTRSQHQSHWVQEGRKIARLWQPWWTACSCMGGANAFSYRVEPHHCWGEGSFVHPSSECRVGENSWA